MKKKTLAAFQPYVWLLPSVILMVGMILIPIISVFKISFSDVGRSGIVRGLNGIQNYLDIFAEPTFWHTLQNTVIWTVVAQLLSFRGQQLSLSSRLSGNIL